MVNNNVRMDWMKRIAISSNSMNAKKMNTDVTMACVFPKNTGSMVSIYVTHDAKVSAQMSRPVVFEQKVLEA